MWHSFHNCDWQQLKYLTVWGKKQAAWWAAVVFDSISTFRLHQNIAVNEVQGQSDLAVEDCSSYWSWQELFQLIPTLRLGQTVHFQILPLMAYFIIIFIIALIVYWKLLCCDGSNRQFEWVGLYMWWVLGLPHGTNRLPLGILLTEALALWQFQKVPLSEMVSLCASLFGTFFLSCTSGELDSQRVTEVRIWSPRRCQCKQEDLWVELLLWYLWMVQFESDPSKARNGKEWPGPCQFETHVLHHDLKPTENSNFQVSLVLKRKSISYNFNQIAFVSYINNSC